MRHGSLFSGIGGFDLAAEWIGWENVFHCEWNEFGQKVLKYYWPKAISYHDITKTDFSIHRGTIDILTGGFPCQPYSAAGKRLGKEDERHLWPEMLRVIREVQPTWVVGENVLGFVNWNGGLVFEEVQADLEAEGYEVQPYVLPACAVNAPHRRDRVWFVAYSNHKGRSKGLGQLQKKDGKVSERNNNAKFSNTGIERTAANTDSLRHRGWCFGPESNQPKERQMDSNTKRVENRIWSEVEGRGRQINNWNTFPTVSPVHTRDDGLSRDTHTETVSKEHRMDRDIVIKKALDQGRLLVDYDTGKIYSTTLRGRIGEKVELPGANCNGYRVHNIYVDGVKKQCKAHQIVWISANGLYDKKKLMIDHINRDKADNRILNLRLVDAKGNAQNTKRWSGNFSQDEKDLMHELHINGHMSFRELAEHFECSKSRVQQIVSQHTRIYGISFPKWRNESIKASGNAIVPQVVYQIFKAIEQYEQQHNTK